MGNPCFTPGASPVLGTRETRLDLQAWIPVYSLGDLLLPRCNPLGARAARVVRKYRALVVPPRTTRLSAMRHVAPMR
jgi:hypothetical protein